MTSEKLLDLTAEKKRYRLIVTFPLVKFLPVRMRTIVGYATDDQAGQIATGLLVAGSIFKTSLATLELSD